MSIENLRGESAHESNFGVTDPGPIELPDHPLDSLESRKVHVQLLDWFYTACDQHYDNRLEQQLDYDFYDHIQWSDQDRAVLAARHQAPLTYNKIKMALDWIIGTERRTRIDGVVHPRTDDDVEIASVKSELIKYLSDINRVPWARSKAFKDQVIAGVGWTEEFVRRDTARDPVGVGHVPWRQMRWDPFSRAEDLSDCRYVIREKFLDLAYAEAMFPSRVDLVQRAARDHLSSDEAGVEEDVDLPQTFRRYDSRGHEVTGRRITGRFSIDQGRSRLRVRLFECWYRKPVPIKKLWGGGFAGVRFDPTNDQHATAEAMIGQEGNVYSLTDAVTEEIWCGIFTEEGLLQHGPSPYRHGQFPYTPYWCYRRDRDGMPYGVVRGVRDSQEDFNKRMSKLLWALSTNQLFYERDAIDEDDLPHIKQELAKPNGVVRVEPGALANGKIKVERNLEVAEAQLKLLELDGAHIHDGSGVNRELMGRDTNASSGRAILAKQQEGSVTTAEPFDLYRLGIQLSGEKQLSLVEQFMTEERQFRIVGEKKGVDWRTINQLRLDTLNNQWVVENDITRNQADFIVDQQDFRESMRQAFAEQFMQLLAQMPPDMSIQLLDLAFELVDIPGKDEIVQRIRKINGQGAADGADDTPEAQAQREQELQAQQQEQALQMRERAAKVGLDEAKAQEIATKAKNLGLKTKADALNLAQLIEVLLPLAPAADRLASDPQYQPAQEDAANAPA